MTNEITPPNQPPHPRTLPVDDAAKAILNPFYRTLRVLRRIKTYATTIEILLFTMRSIVIGIIVAMLWGTIRPEGGMDHLALGTLAMIISFLLPILTRPRTTLSASAILTDWEMSHPEKRTSAFNLRDDQVNSHELIAEWQPVLNQAPIKHWTAHRRRLASVSRSLAAPLAALLILNFSVPSQNLGATLAKVVNAVNELTEGATLTVLSGATDGTHSQPVSLSRLSPAEIELLSDNMVEIRLAGGNRRAQAPTVELSQPGSMAKANSGNENKTTTSDATSVGGGTRGGDVYQSFQMIPAEDSMITPTDEDAPFKDTPIKKPWQGYSVTFAVPRSVDVYIPTYAGNNRLATINIKELPVPKVKLTLASSPQDPWPDDQALNLKINVSSTIPLQQVRLLIKSNNRTSQELVSNVMATDKTELDLDYQLIVEPYVEQDIAEVEIVAEAIDRSLPNPLIGRSEPLQITTASAYGRYLQTLRTLRELKTAVDEALTANQDKIGKSFAQDGKNSPKDLISRATKQAVDSPFFDSVDRVDISKFDDLTQQLATNPSTSQALELQSSLNDFLFEHEMLDDRERDRDFFVAARNLSRLIEQDPRRRPVAVNDVTGRIKTFLDDRERRWELRVKRLGKSHEPPSWPKITSEHPFHRSITRIDDLDRQHQNGDNDKIKGRTAALTTLSQVVVAYRNWIEELEGKEDQARQEMERKRQEGIASARNEIREIQKKQGQISEKLDRATEQDQSKLEEEWGFTRMLQNDNIAATKKIEAKMRALSPSAGERLKLAIESMETTVDAGSSGSFQQAETASDLAGRLLRQAESAASQSQQSQRNRGRRRRINGDNHYGRTILPGDIEIKRNYEVERRYREDILDEVRNAEVDEENRTVLDNYLRRMIR